MRSLLVVRTSRIASWNIYIELFVFLASASLTTLSTFVTLNIFIFTIQLSSCTTDGKTNKENPRQNERFCALRTRYSLSHKTYSFRYQKKFFHTLQALKGEKYIGHRYSQIQKPSLEHLVPSSQLRTMRQLWNSEQSRFEMKAFFKYWGRVWALSNFEIERLVRD